MRSVALLWQSIVAESMLMRWYYALIAVLIPALVVAQPTRTYRVFFRDKGPAPFAPNTALYNQTLALHSPRALARRAKVFPSDSIIMWSDAPLYQPYLDELERSGARLLLRLRWRNYAVVECDSATAAILRTKPFVRDVQPTSSVLRPQRTLQRWWQCDASTEYRYGASLEQLQMLHIPELHELALSGADILIGLIDTGFRWRDHVATGSACVIAEYDFIQRDSITANEPGDPPTQDSHGTAVFSVLAGNYPDSLVGAAPCSGFLLAKTEDVAHERRIEEDAYAAAVEWLEAQGVDIISSSLGYDKFDSTEVAYQPGDFNGRTTIVACVAQEAARRGVVLVTAAGNDGDAPQTIASPGDAEGAITVGAVADAALTVPRFTSRGPTADGRLKPDLAALGVGVRTASAASSLAFSYSSGTSMATPLIAGVAALLLQAHPELTPSELRRLLCSNASHAHEPNYAIGYGVPNALAAALDYGIVCSPPAVIPQGDSILVAIAARSKSALTSAQLFLQTPQGEMLATLAPSGRWILTARVPRSTVGDTLRWWIVLQDSARTKRQPPQGVFVASSRDTLLPCGWSLDRLSSVVATHSLPARAPAVALPRSHAVLPLPQAGATVCVVYDLLLRRVATVSIDPFATSVDLSFLERGTYVVQLRSDRGNSVSQLVMVY